MEIKTRRLHPWMSRHPCNSRHRLPRVDLRLRSHSHTPSEVQDSHNGIHCLCLGIEAENCRLPDNHLGYQAHSFGQPPNLSNLKYMYQNTSTYICIKRSGVRVSSIPTV